jgi:pyruvate ferredoxin oxidoreductase gamma subunit
MANVVAVSVQRTLYEIRFHGRAGQGILTASRLFAEAAVLNGKYAQAFPDFGPERLGSPVSAFARVDNQPIEIHSQIYAPDAVVVFERSLLTKVPVTVGLPATGQFVVNASQSSEVKANEGSFSTFLIDATKIASELGSKVVSTIMLGALGQVSSIVGPEALESAVRRRFKGAVADLNAKMVQMGFQGVHKI